MPQRRVLPWTHGLPDLPCRVGRWARISWSEVVKMKTILLIDYNAEHLLRHNELLNEAGYRVVTAQDGRSALFIIESGMLLDLIVTEYTVPDMEPREFLAAVRKKAPAVPVIVVTGCDSVECYIHAINLGVYEYLSKPVLPGELRSIVGTALETRRSGSLPAGLA